MGNVLVLDKEKMRRDAERELWGVLDSFCSRQVGVLGRFIFDFDVVRSSPDFEFAGIVLAWDGERDYLYHFTSSHPEPEVIAEGTEDLRPLSEGVLAYLRAMGDGKSVYECREILERVQRERQAYYRKRPRFRPDLPVKRANLRVFGGK